MPTIIKKTIKSQITLIFFLFLFCSSCLAQENKVKEFKPLAQLKVLKYKLETTESDCGYVKLTSREVTLFCTVVDLKGLDLKNLLLYQGMQYAPSLVEDCSFKQDKKVTRAISLLLEIASKKKKEGLEIEYLFALGQKLYFGEPFVFTGVKSIEEHDEMETKYALKLQEVKSLLSNKE